eukprot:g48501.t1
MIHDVEDIEEKYSKFSQRGDKRNDNNSPVQTHPPPKNLFHSTEALKKRVWWRDYCRSLIIYAQTVCHGDTEANTQKGTVNK